MDKTCGVYAITNKVNSKQYIGSSVNVKHRFSVHRAYLRRGEHHSHILQKDWNEFSEDVFEVVILEEMPPDTPKAARIAREQYYIDTLEPVYNISRFAHYALADPAIKARVRYGREVRDYDDPEYRKHQSEAHLGVPLSETHRRRIGEVQKDRKLPEEWKQNIARAMQNNPKTRYKKSDEHKRKASSIIAEKWQDPEYRARIIAAQNEGKRKRREALRQQQEAQ